jgi:hypothetical protein
MSATATNKYSRAHAEANAALTRAPLVTILAVVDIVCIAIALVRVL